MYQVGDTVGELTITDFIFKKRPDGRNRRLLVVRCSCGNVKEVLPSNVASGDTASCGCLHRRRASEANKTHGAKSKNATSTQKRLMSIWRGMKNRCENHAAQNYRWYGAKGIAVEWPSFEEFYTWSLLNGYTEELEIDRINPAGNYSPSNCMWCSKSDNIARAHLKIDENIKIEVIAQAKRDGLSFSSIVESALLTYLDARKEVMENGN